MKSKRNSSRSLAWAMPVLLGVLVAACGDDGGRDPILGIPDIVDQAPQATLAPTVTDVVPDNDAFNVAFNNTVITATFSEAMMPITGDSSFVIECFAPCVNPTGVVTLDMTNTMATYTLDAPLAPITAYVVTITGAQNIADGVALAEPYVWHFTTGATSDTTQPTVTVTFPATTVPGPTLNAPTNAAITAVFSEDMLEASITAPGSFTLTCESPCVSPVAGTVSYSAPGKTASFTPDADLDVDTTYTATIAATATDIALNGLAGNLLPAPPAASAYEWTFTTAAALPPQNISVDDLTIVPDANAVGVCPTHAIKATFVVPSMLRMSDATVNSSTFSVTGPGPLFTPVEAASVVLDSATGTIATFTSMDPLTEGVTYIVTIRGGVAGVKDAAIPGNEMTADYTWEFTAGPPTGACIPAVDLGVIATFGIAATAGVTNTGATTINGNVVLDPIAGATCNFVQVDAAGGFGLCGGSPPAINGLVISPLYPDAGSTSGAVKADLLAVFLSITPPAGPPAAGSMNMADVINLPAATTLGAPTGNAEVTNDNLFYPGLYQSLTSILITGDIMLDAQGDENAVFIFQSSSSLDTAAGAISPGAHTRILLRNGAKASNVWWQVGSSATLGTHTEFVGNILASENITMETGASSCGRLLAGAFTAGAFVLDSNVVSVPGNGCPE